MKNSAGTFAKKRLIGQKQIQQRDQSSPREETKKRLWLSLKKSKLEEL
jgi:hypothetical protein